MGPWEAQEVGDRKALEPGSLIVDLKKPKMLRGSREHVQPGTGSEPGTSAGMRDSVTAQQALAVYGWESEPEP